jgi:hypothetical protein
VTEIYGPSQLGESMLWEVWVEDKDGELATRFVEETDDGTRAYDTFQLLAVRLNTLQQTNLATIAQREAERTLQAATISNQRIELIVKLGMAVVGFTVAMAVVGYLAVNNKEGNIPYMAAVVFAGLIASAGAYVYGRYFIPKIPGVGIGAAVRGTNR